VYRGLWGSASFKVPTFSAGDFDLKGVDKTDLLLGVRSGSSVDLYMQDYKSLCAAATICVTLVNIQTHT